MKKTLLLFVFAMMVSFSALAQSKNPEKSAKWATDKMTELLGLKEGDSKKVYDIQLEKTIKLNEALKKYENDEDGLKMAKKPIYADANSKLQEIIGKEGLNKWKTYLQGQKE
ncbi:hypothetical protein SLW70_14745 [Flavobacterium sp. NG2]|uniref:hypothetical protein n=1 Tax=Flavobacterium sp. NG2 TaxID=3097547 RepID=UPI002A7F203C|nr:hypothetical protein [Flavobacterium sp. NG2]WPR71184.1 hypothetical protein SLW70_14745 [Flavobacterium sp. NG2]